MEDLLSSWDISEETIAVFRNQNIDITCIDGLGDDELKILIPDNKLRDRIKFKSGLRSYREELETVHSNTDSIDTASCDSIESLVFSDGDAASEQENLQFNLLEILSDNIHGRQALQAVKAKKLDSKSRNNLVKGVIEYFLKKNIKLSKVDFQNIAKEIERQCPKECKETYYVPSRTYGVKQNMPAKGKLVDRYYNQLRSLRGSGVLPQKRKIESALENIESEAENIEETFTWLKYNRDPWPLIEEKWQETCAYRKRKTYDSPIKLIDVWNEWPCLKSINGHRLIEIDFRFIHPEKELKLLEKWETFTNKTSNIIKAEFPEHPVTLYLGEDHANTDTQNFAVLTSLAHKIKPTSKIVITGDEKKHHKVSVAESQQSFIMLVENYAGIEEHLNNKRKSYNRIGLTCQPSIVCVGTPDKLEAFYVVIEDVRYRFDSLTKAVDVCFKCFTVLNLEYPKECEQIWLFIQHYFYNIHLKSDKKFSQVVSFIKELN